MLQNNIENNNVEAANNDKNGLIQETENSIKIIIDEYLAINTQIRELKQKQKKLIPEYKRLNKKIGQLVKNKE